MSTWPLRKILGFATRILTKPLSMYSQLPTYRMIHDGIQKLGAGFQLKVSTIIPKDHL